MEGRKHRLAIVGRLIKHPGFKLAKNATWLIVEKCVRLLIGLVIGVLVARYLGPARYGALQYANALYSFVGIVVFLGLHGIIVRDIVKYPERKTLVLGTTAGLKLMGGVFGYAMVAVFALLFSQRGGEEFWTVMIVCATLILEPLEVFDYWFESQVQAKYSSARKIISLAVVSSGRIVLLLVHAPLVAFAAMVFLEAAIAGTMVLIFYTRNQRDTHRWRFSWQIAKYFLSQSWLLLLTGVMVNVNLKVDQLMLKWMKGGEAVGIYAVAVLFSETWYFISDAVATTVYPVLIRTRRERPQDYPRRLQQVYDLLFLLALSVAIVVSFLGPELIRRLYGQAFSGAAVILSIHVWAGLFAFMRALSSKWLLIENKLVFSLATNAGGALVNVVLNLFLIPRFGGIGSAVATLLSYASSGYFAMFLWKGTRGAAVMQSIALLSPFRYTYKLARRVLFGRRKAA